MTARQLVKKMMTFRPVSSDKRAVNRLVGFVRTYLEGAGLTTGLERVDGRSVLYASTSKGKMSRLLFNPHLDVVPADESMFRPRERGGRIYGRGAADCLGNCAVTMRLLERLNGRADAAAVFSTDEELGGHTVAAMVRRGYRGDFVIIMDGGPYRIAVAQKGIRTVKLTARGKACHGSAPWRGVNAIDRLIEGYLRIRRLFPAVKPDAWRTTMSANVIHGGTVFNRVPDSAEMVLDIRYTEKVSPRDLVARLRTVSGLNVSSLHSHPVVFCNGKDPRITALAAHMRKALRRRIKMVRMMGATDARHFVSLGVPIAIIGVPAKGAHCDVEWVDVKGMKRYEDMLYAYCLKG